MSSQFTPPPYGGSTADVSDLALPLSMGRGWMKFVGIMSIIQGVFIALSIVGILVAWLPIWLGVLIMQAADAIERAQRSGDALAMKEAMGKLKTYFVIQGVLYLVGIVFMVLYIVFFGAMMFAAFKHGGFPH
jgi:hypothetical protein